MLQAPGLPKPLAMKKHVQLRMFWVRGEMPISLGVNPLPTVVFPYPNIKQAVSPLSALINQL